MEKLLLKNKFSMKIYQYLKFIGFYYNFISILLIFLDFLWILLNFNNGFIFWRFF